MVNGRPNGWGQWRGWFIYIYIYIYTYIFVNIFA